MFSYRGGLVSGAGMFVGDHWKQSVEVSTIAWFYVDRACVEIACGCNV